jgi:hypothetical protein
MNTPAVSRTFDVALWNQVVSFVSNHPVDPSPDGSLLTHKKIYQTGRQLLGWLADAQDAAIAPLQSLQQELALTCAACQEKTDLVESLQARLSATQDALLLAVGSSTPRREKIPEPTSTVAIALASAIF